MAGVQAIQARVKGYLANFEKFHSIAQEQETPEWIKELTEEVTSDGFSEKYHGYNSPPLAQNWERGTQPTYSGFDEFIHEIANEDYVLGIEWHENDEADERSPASMKARIQEGAKRLAQLDRRIVPELMTATYSLLKTTPKCFDGYDLYSASHTMRTGGNITTGHGVATADDVATDLWAVLNAYREMKDTEGEDLYPDDMLSSENIKFYIVCAPANEQVIYHALNRTLDLTNGALVAVSNVLPQRFKGARLIPFQKVSGNDIRVFMGGVDRPFIKQKRQSVRSRDFTYANSDAAARTKMLAMQWDLRMGFGLKNWRSTMLIDN